MVIDLNCNEEDLGQRFLTAKTIKHGNSLPRKAVEYVRQIPGWIHADVTHFAGGRQIDALPT